MRQPNKWCGDPSAVEEKGFLRTIGDDRYRLHIIQTLAPSHRSASSVFGSLVMYKMNTALFYQLVCFAVWTNLLLAYFSQMLAPSHREQVLI